MSLSGLTNHRLRLGLCCVVASVYVLIGLYLQLVNKSPRSMHRDQATDCRCQNDVKYWLTIQKEI